MDQITPQLTKTKMATGCLWAMFHGSKFIYEIVSFNFVLNKKSISDLKFKFSKCTECSSRLAKG